MLFFVTLIVFIGIEQISCARQKSPLLVEDDGNRRNRPAGELKFILQIHKTKRTVKKRWNELACFDELECVPAKYSRIVRCLSNDHKKNSQILCARKVSNESEDVF